MRHGGSKWRRRSVQLFAIVCAIFTTFVVLLMMALLTLRPDTPLATSVDDFLQKENDVDLTSIFRMTRRAGSKRCATVEEMGEDFKGAAVWQENLRVRKLIQRHFDLNGASRVRNLPPEQFCEHAFVMGKASEAGFGNEMYKILTGAALSIMLNRSLIIGQTRHIGVNILLEITFLIPMFPLPWKKSNIFGDAIIALKGLEDIWFQGTTDAMAAQFFLKNVHPEMRVAASDLFGHPESLQSQPNVFGELMRVLISPSEDVKEAVDWVVGNGTDPDISLHTRMLMNRSVRAVHAALKCIRKVMQNLHQASRPRVVLVSDTPSFVESIAPSISEFAEVLHFDYKHFKGNLSRDGNSLGSKDFRVKDWGPAPRWVAFVDFFLAARAKHAVVSGAQRRVATTYAQLIASLAAANNLGDNSTGSSFSFLSSFQSNLVSDGLKLQVGWGHAWNRFAGPLSCHRQPHQCAYTPLLPPAWWDGLWQSPIARDIRRMEAFGINLSGFGTVDMNQLQSFCSSKKNSLKTVLLL
ncbi:hypothetical protein JRO89_XS01G0214500 [Xanthoceras sorbifolium]|uniref:Uncharacterized protein n=1 Tax=Xanthoceras sorbifolium TaxID=99658 RepID=A0ABQ8IKD8_9ROSI|nr:hypothetical protein JRO89_XS01G0214500 [Xanthoceras sorbifolium]